MTLPDAVLDALWYAVTSASQRSKRLRVAGNAIADFWAQNPYEYGACLSGEIQDGPAVYQVFTRWTLRWTPIGGVEALSK